MVLKFPGTDCNKTNRSALRIRLDMTFDVPEKLAEQLELWGVYAFEDCEYDQEQQQLKMSAVTTLYHENI